jgi:hypothetical protein
MSSNVIFMGWSGSIPGREKISAQHFQEFVGYLEGLQKSGAILSFETIFLHPHGGDLNGFFIIRGEHNKLDALSGDEAWEQHITRAGLHLQGLGVVRGASGELIADLMQRWTKAIPA